MNKLFTKIATAFVGMAMAIGVGVVVGTGNNDLKEAKAALVAAYTLTPATGSNSGYTSSGDVTVSSIVWNVGGNNTLTPWRLGGKKSGSETENVDRVIYSKTAITDTIMSITVNIGNSGNLAASNYKSATLTVSSASNGGGTVYSSITSNSFKKGASFSFSKPGGDSDWTNAFYKFSFNIDFTSTSNNYFEFSSAVFYKEGQEVVLEGLDVSDISLYPGQTTSATVAPDPANAQLPNDLTYSSSNTSVATVDSSGNVAAVSTGVSTLTVSSESADVDGTATITVSNYPAYAGLSTSKTYNLVGEKDGNYYELSGFGSGVGSATSCATSAGSNTYPITVGSGKYLNTFTLKIGSNYLALNSNGNNLHSVAEGSFDSNSLATMWTISVVDAKLIISPLSFLSRSLRFNYNNGDPRFACYVTSSTSLPTPSFAEIGTDDMTDFAIDSTMELWYGKTRQIGITYTPANPVDTTLSWVSDAPDVATVSSTGLVTAVAAGTAHITATKEIDEVDVVRTCTVTVLGLDHAGTAIDPYSVADAHNIIDNSLSIADTVYIKGIYISTAVDWSSEFKNVSIYVKDTVESENQFEFFRMAAKVEPVLTANVSEVVISAANGDVKKYYSTYEAYGCTYVDPDKSPVDSFVSTYMKLNDANFDSEDYVHKCDLDDGEGNTPYSLAKSAFNGLTQRQRELFVADTTNYAAAYARLLAWADANGDKIDDENDYSLVNKSRALNFVVNDSNDSSLIIVVLSSISLIGVGGLLFLRKKKEQ